MALTTRFPFPVFSILGVAALLALGACTANTKPGNGGMPDGVVNHPITVEPSYKSLKLAFTPGGLSQSDAVALDNFVADYRDHGNGAIAVSAPASGMGQGSAGWLADHINAMGISRDKILVAAHDAPDGDMRVEVNYVSYAAHTDKCGDWSENLDVTWDNSTPKNFGCAVQQNIAAMVADPRDLVHPRPSEPNDSARGVTVMGNYEQGKITSADKRKNDLGNEQSGLSAASQ